MNNDDQPIVDKSVVRMFMFDLYSEPRTIFREYIQNAYDAITEAVEQNILTSIKDGMVYVNIDQTNHIVTVEDNGIGVQSEIAAKVLKSIGVSTKKHKGRAGFMGIGRLVGGGYCRELIFETSAKDENVISKMTFDVPKIDKLLEDDNYESATEVIAATTKFETIRVDKTEDIEKHFFKVILNDVSAQYTDMLLNEESIKKYLLQTAPIPFNMMFKRIIKKSIKEHPNYEPFFSNLGYIRLNLNKNVDLQKLYSDEVEGTGSGSNDKIDKLRVFELNDDDGQKLAWGWYAITPFTQKIAINPQTELTKGIRLRVKNIQVGDYNFFGGEGYFTQSRNNEYFIGEIHTIHPNIKPTPERENLVPTIEAKHLKLKIKEFFKEELSKVVSGANDTKNAIKKYKEADKQLAELENKETSPEFTEEVKQEKIEQAIEEKQKASNQLNNLMARRDKEETSLGLKEVLDLYKSQIAESDIKVAPKPKESSKTPKEDKKTDIKAKIDLLSAKYSKAQMKIIKQVIKLLDRIYGKTKYADLVKSIEYSILDGLDK